MPLSDTDETDAANVAARAAGIEKAFRGQMRPHEEQFARAFGGTAGQPLAGFFATPEQAHYFENGGSVRAWAGILASRVAALPDAKLLASEGNDRVVRLWNVADGALVRTFDATPLHVYEGGQQVHYGGVRSMAFRPDAKQFVAGGLHKGSNPLGNVQEPLMLRFNWDDAPPPPAPPDPKAAPGTPPPPIGVKPVRTHLSDGNPNERIWALAYHAQGFVVAAIGGGKGALLFWNEGEEKPFHTFALPNTARGMSLHADGIQIATTHHDSKLRVTRLETKRA